MGPLRPPRYLVFCVPHPDPAPDQWAILDRITDEITITYPHREEADYRAKALNAEADGS